MLTSSTIHAVVLSSLFAVTSSVRADETAERRRLLAESREANRKAIEAIRTLSTAFELTIVQKDSAPQIDNPDWQAPVGPGMYRHAGDYYRIRSTRAMDGYTSDLVSRCGRGHCYSSEGPISKPTFTVGPTEHRTRLWIWNYLLLSHPGPEANDLFPFHELLNEPHTLTAVERDADQVRIEVSHAGGQLEFRLSLKHNGMVRNRVWKPNGENRCYETAVTEFAEPEPGVHFPKVIEYRTLANGQLRELRRMTMSDLIVNKPLPLDAFQIPGLADKLFDGLSPGAMGGVGLSIPVGAQFHVDAHGYQVKQKPAEPEPVTQMTIRPLPFPGMSDGNLTQAARLEPPPLTPWWVWGIIASLGVVVLAAGMEIQRLRKLIPGDGTKRPSGG